MCLFTVCTHTAVILPIIKVKDKLTHTDVNTDRKNQKNRHNMVETDQILEKTRTHTLFVPSLDPTPVGQLCSQSPLIHVWHQGGL